MSIQRKKNISHIRLLFLKPEVFWQKLVKKCVLAWKSFIIDPPTRCFIEHNKKLWKGWVDPQAGPVILVEWQSIPLWYLQAIPFVNVLARKKGARICSFARGSIVWRRADREVCRSANITGHIAAGTLSASQRVRRDRIFGELLTQVRTKEDVFNLRVNGIHVGIDLYETYLREFNRPTVVMDEALRDSLRYAVGLVVFWEDYFQVHQVAGVVVLHDCYLDYNVAVKVAYQREVPVYVQVGPYIARAKAPHEARAFHYNYREWFAALDEKEKKEGLVWAKSRLEKHFRGEKVEELYYTIGSPFKVQENAPRIVKESDRLKVLICSHCFYDSPHSYGGMLFIDFYEWLKYLLNIARQTDYDWYLKTHPQPLPGTVEIIREIIGDSGRITLVPSRTSHLQLVREGIDCVLTAYGTVGHEYPLLGAQVVNAGYNPHVAYDFNWTPRTLEEYEYFLLNLKTLSKDIRWEDVCEFYFMNYNYCIVDDLSFPSFRAFPFKLHTRSASYAYYLDRFTDQWHQGVVRRMEDFIDSGKQFFLLKGPVDAVKPRPTDTAYLT